MREDTTDFAALFTSHARELARCLLQTADRKGLCIATAESCTGGLLSTVLTDVPGVSHCFECGFVVYSDSAKSRQLGVPPDLIERYGAVSQSVAICMAEQALKKSDADVTLSITGFAGPAGDCDEEGLVHFAVACCNLPTLHREEHFGQIGRDAVRARALEVGLEMLRQRTALA